MKMEQNTTQTSTALLSNANGVDTPETNNLCCAAAGIIAPLSPAAEALIPHKKLREAATPDATLTARSRPPAQPAMGYRPLLPYQETRLPPSVKVLPIDERAEHYAYSAGFAGWMCRAWKQSTLGQVRILVEAAT